MKTHTTTHTTDLALRRLEVTPTETGHRVRLIFHEVTAVNGNPVSTEEKVYDNDLGGVNPDTLSKAVDAIVAAIKARDY